MSTAPLTCGRGGREGGGDRSGERERGERKDGKEGRGKRTIPHTYIRNNTCPIRTLSVNLLLIYEWRLAALDRWLHYTATTIDRFHRTSNVLTRGGWLL